MSMMLDSCDAMAMTRKPKRVLDTQAADERGFATPPRSRFSMDWDQIFKKLGEWGREPGKIDEDDLEFPSYDAISEAIAIIQRVNHRETEPAPSIVPDGEGGIAIRWSSGDDLQTLQISGDGHIEYLRFRGSRLVDRFPVVSPRD
jgi:hypothetical protein